SSGLVSDLRRALIFSLPSMAAPRTTAAAVYSLIWSSVVAPCAVCHRLQAEFFAIHGTIRSGLSFCSCHPKALSNHLRWAYTHNSSAARPKVATIQAVTERSGILLAPQGASYASSAAR